MEGVIAPPPTIIVMIRRAKYNFKYKRRKGDKPRLNKDDLTALAHMLDGTRVTFVYDAKTNDLRFDTQREGSDHIIIDGEDTGGQLIRTAMALAVKISGGRTAPLGVLQLRSPEKACMLYVQAAMHMLEPGESFTIRGGNPLNADAPTFRDYQNIFEVLRGLIGLSYALLDESDATCSQFTLLRATDTKPNDGWNQGASNLSIHTVDQILMALVFAVPGISVTIRCDCDPDYHISAMVKMLRLVGHTVADTIDSTKSSRTLSITSTEVPLVKSSP